MPDPELDNIDETEEIDESQETADQDDLPDETALPDDPAELKKIAATAIQSVKSAQKREADLQAERDRLKEAEEEQRTKATYWATDAQAKRDELAQLKGKGTKAKPEPKDKDDDLELAVAVTEGMTLKDIDKRAEAIARRIVEDTTANLSKQGEVANVLTASYPDLKDRNSALAKATIAEMAKIDEETPGMGDAAKFELATLRSAGRLGISPKTQENGNGKGSEQKERERRRAAQGGPTGKANANKGAVVITAQDRAEARKMNGGQDVPDSVLINAKKFEQERQSVRERA